MKTFVEFWNDKIYKPQGAPPPPPPNPNTQPPNRDPKQQLIGAPYFVNPHDLQQAIEGDDQALARIGTRHGKHVYLAVSKLRGQGR